MIIDARTEFQLHTTAITGTVGAHMCTNSVDLGDSQIAPGSQIVIEIHTAPGSAGHASTVKFDLVTASSAAGLSAGTVVGSTGVIAEAVLVAGKTLSIPIDQKVGAFSRHIGLQYTVGTEDITSGGTFSAYVGSKLNPVSRIARGIYRAGI